jgi:hypothetical protein
VSAKHWLLLGVFGVALVVNPYLGCNHSGESDFTYAEADMRDAVLGAWQGSADIDGESVPFSLVLEQARAKSKTQAVMAPKAEPPCGSRSFVKPAAACLSSSDMPVIGTLSSENPALDGAVEGRAQAFRTLDSVSLTLSLQDGKVLTGAIEKQGLSEGRVTAAGQLGTFSMARR